MCAPADAAWQRARTRQAGAWLAAQADENFSIERCGTFELWREICRDTLGRRLFIHRRGERGRAPDTRGATAGAIEIWTRGRECVCVAGAWAAAAAAAHKTLELAARKLAIKIRRRAMNSPVLSFGANWARFASTLGATPRACSFAQRKTAFRRPLDSQSS